MKKLLKSEVCGSHKQCTDTLFTGEKSTTAVKKKHGNADADLNPNTHYKSILKKNIYIYIYI